MYKNVTKLCQYPFQRTFCGNILSASRRFFFEEAFFEAAAAAAAAAAADPGPTGGPGTIGPRISTGRFDPGGGPIIPNRYCKICRNNYNIYIFDINK